jgi:hypothetical protein
VGEGLGVNCGLGTVEEMGEELVPEGDRELVLNGTGLLVEGDGTELDGDLEGEDEQPV